MVIAVDAFGSDKAPLPEVEGSVEAIKKGFCEKILLVGKKETLNLHLSQYDYDKNKIEVIDAKEVITMQDFAATSFRKKKDSSLIKAITLHKNRLADAIVSAGNTGAVMTASLLIYGRMKNIDRPAIATMFPTKKNPQIVLDVGANVDSKPHNLVQFAEIGSLYAKYFLKRDKPKVSLLNIGEEEKKGNELTKAAYQLLKKDISLNFVGNIEGKEILEGKTDVVVCDGFTGNVLLKTTEGTLSFLSSIIKSQLKRSLISKIGTLFFLPMIKYFKKTLDPSMYGGALLTGLNGISIISHGSSNSKSICSAIRFANEIVASGFVEHSKEFFINKGKK